MASSIDANVDFGSSKTLNVRTLVECFVVVRNNPDGDFSSMSVQNCGRDSVVGDRENADVDGVASRFQQARDSLPAMIARTEDDFRIGRGFVGCSGLSDDLRNILKPFQHRRRIYLVDCVSSQFERRLMTFQLRGLVFDEIFERVTKSTSLVPRQALVIQSLLQDLRQR